MDTTQPRSVVVGRFNSEFLDPIDEIPGCRSLFCCRLQQKKQLEALRSIADGLESSYEAPGMKKWLVQQLPRVIPLGSSPTRFDDAFRFWQAIQLYKKKIENIELAACRRLLKKSKKKDDKKTRYSLQFSLSLIGKSLRPPCRCFSFVNDSSSHREGISREDTVSPEFLGFVKDLAKKLFRRGWDSGYKNECVGARVSDNACYEKKRCHYGPLGILRKEGQLAYLQKVLGDVPVTVDPVGRYSTVNSAGKVRPLSMMHSSYEYLRPLHKTLYNYLSRFPWLLRGSPSKESFPFHNDEGQFVSVDFTNATDNLSVNVAEAFLGVALCQSVNIPEDIKVSALRALRPTLMYDQQPVELSMGQMMGSLLSFPLLCLQTFSFYLYSAGLTGLSSKKYRSYDRCKVNGDDLVFKSTDAEKFFLDSQQTLSVINRKKTHVSERYFNINSTLFESHRGVCCHIPFLRPAQLFFETAADLGSRVFETTRWLNGRLKKSAFKWAMSRAVWIAKRQGWSFLKCGFFGAKQAAFLWSHSSYEELVRCSREESPVPRPESELQTVLLPAPAWVHDFLVPEQLEMLSRVWTSRERFVCPLSIDGGVGDDHRRPSFNEERAFEADKFDWKEFRKAEDLRWEKARRMGLGRGRYPRWHQTTVWPTARSLKRNMFEEITKKRLKEKKFDTGLIPSGLLRLLESLRESSSRLYIGNGDGWTWIHQAQIDVVKKIFAYKRKSGRVK
jgi:hypothetical protein